MLDLLIPKSPLVSGLLAAAVHAGTWLFCRWVGVADAGGDE
jgi:hypothetical protein